MIFSIVFKTLSFALTHTHTVPHYLRTKLDLDLEAKQKEAKDESIRKSSTLKEEIRRFNNMLSGSLDRVNELQGELEEQRTRAGEYVWGCMNVCVCGKRVYMCEIV